MTDIMLPVVAETTVPMLQTLTEALGVPRDILASDEEIAHAWYDLPRQTSPYLIGHMLALTLAGVSSDKQLRIMWRRAAT